MAKTNRPKHIYGEEAGVKIVLFYDIRLQNVLYLLCVAIATGGDNLLSDLYQTAYNNSDR